jgi:PIN domain nuclease of toxin-antitoxin system
MRLLLDTHAFLWWLDGDRRLSRRARALIGDARQQVFVSAASAWEIATKARLGKLPGAEDVAADIVGCVASQDFTPLAISLAHAQAAGRLGGEHRDPFDRVLAAQALIEALPLLTNDPAFEAFGVPTLW